MLAVVAFMSYIISKVGYFVVEIICQRDVITSGSESLGSICGYLFPAINSSSNTTHKLLFPDRDSVNLFTLRGSLLIMLVVNVGNVFFFEARNTVFNSRKNV